MPSALAVIPSTSGSAATTSGTTAVMLSDEAVRLSVFSGRNIYNSSAARVRATYSRLTASTWLYTSSV